NNEAMFEFWLLNKEGLKPEVRLDPTLDRAIQLLLAEDFILRNERAFKINEKGLKVAEKLLSLDVFKEERLVLNKHKAGLSETNINKIFQVG
ncbi:TPA: serine/threonine protein kinase, partial [Escherichia coli]|nr:serine/threonine protein kinase [Escherichia coli]